MKNNAYTKIALSIAGSDPSSGAGIEADLKTFSALGVYGTIAITAITVQNTRGVKHIEYIDPKLVVEQVKVILEDMNVSAIKIGLLGKKETINALADILKTIDKPIVIDPIIYAKDGTRFLDDEALKILTNKLLPISTIVTPNRIEAEILAGMNIKDLEDAKKAAKHIVEELGVKAAVIKGGHFQGDFAIDIAYYNGEYREYASPRITSEEVHGTGCVFSAAIAAELAKGKNIFEAINVAKQFITLAIDYRLKLGKGYSLVNPLAWIDIAAEKYHVLENMKEALKIIEEHGNLISKYVPEVQINLVMALPKPYTRDVNDVAGILGRIVRYGDTVKPAGPITFGVSRHLARAILKIMEYDPSVRAAINIKYDEKIIEKAKYLGYKVSFYDRSKEPPEIKKKEGASIPWGIEQAIKRIRGIPDLVYHLGDWGKEPMIVLFGKTAVDVVKKLIRILTVPN